MFDHINGLFHVHKATKNFITVSVEVADAFYYKSCAHCSAAVLLVAKLQIVHAERFVKKQNYNRIFSEGYCFMLSICNYHYIRRHPVCF